MSCGSLLLVPTIYTALRLGRKIRWDPTAEQMLDDRFCFSLESRRKG
jgi:hypothetical protein